MNIDLSSLEDTVKVGLLAYPSLFPTREYVIDHLYCVLGNGYDWEGGALVETCHDGKDAIVVKMLREGKSEEEVRSYVADDEDDKRFNNLMKDVEERFPEYKRKLFPELERKLKIYPICELCPILELPKDIHPDWLAGAEEALRLIETYPSFDEAGTIENRTKWAPLIRALIEKRRTA